LVCHSTKRVKIIENRPSRITGRPEAGHADGVGNQVIRSGFSAQADVGSEPLGVAAWAACGEKPVQAGARSSQEDGMRRRGGIVLQPGLARWA
jgi:hypothetical protein